MLISLPDGYFSSTTNLISQLSTDLKDLIILALGIPLAFWVLSKLIRLILSGFGKR